MIVRFGTDVQDGEGGKLAEVTRVILDPETQEIVTIVARNADIDGEEVLIPIGTVASGDDQVLTVAMDKDQFDGLESFEWVQNVAPPPGVEPTEEPGLPDVPPVPPVGAATGVESIAYTPLLQESFNIPSGDAVIDKDTAIWATDGLLGKARQVEISDETRRLQSLTLAHGLIFTDDVTVSADLITSIRPDTIILSVEQRALEGQDDAGH
jgi:sporulation protein YlmC with PRC-barrel domain